MGKGKGDRVYSHVWVARGETTRVKDGIENDPAVVKSAKNQRIEAIYRAGERVEHFIVRPNISPPEDSDTLAFQFEQVLIAAFRLVENDLANPVLTNIQGGHVSREFIVQPVEETIKQFAARPADKLPTPCAVLVSKNPALKWWSDEEIYNNLAGWWFARRATKMPDLPVFIVHAGLIRAVFRAERWEQAANLPAKWRFHGPVDTQLVESYRGTSLSYKDIERNPRLKGWSTLGWHLIK
ncbi:GIY-YIG nuclease family protein [Gordonia sp. zg691]|uniref:GIY-YIG nuclease family protein n=1 Tax=Gordonia jinghuaiqii TaxID=2758710 RepID=UPI0016621F33|nr:GIY-YIG nuclease family protein [Gordonia jinghuaiqii]MBD0862447.1 GIY-YIG nuclease family protein [Gordonia jinghuaiqii]